MELTEIELPCGQCPITARIPTRNIVDILTRQDASGLADEREAIIQSLRSPIESPPLRDLIKPSDKVVVIATDNTRPCPDDRILPPLLAELESVIPRDNITIIIALGLHPPLNRTELSEKLGEAIVAGYNVVNHDVNDTVYIGTTSRGTPVDINRRVIAADFRISTGFIEPHFFAGFSGGRKSIAPGVFSVRSAYHNHGYQMIEHPQTRAGILKGNQLHEDLVEQAQMAKLNFIVNVLLNKNREITHVVAGHPFMAHEKGCQIEKEIAGVEVSQRADITITTNSGAPLDLDLYQTCKGIDTAAHQGSLEGGGRTLAVLGCGLDVVYPPENRELYARIPENGALISEYLLGAPPEAHNFPRRNRLVSGLAFGVLVVEAGAKSGANITAQCALEQGREVLAVPGPITSPTSQGPHNWIKEGAKLVQNVNDILAELPQTRTPVPPQGEKPSEGPVGPRPTFFRVDDPLLPLLGAEPLQLEELVQASHLPAPEVMSRLTLLELQGLVRELPGKCYVLTD